jgi:alkaline phosphatase
VIAGKATGVISTARITHATPAAAYAHSVHRDYEAFLMHGNTEDLATGCTDIATQLVRGVTGKDLNVSQGRPKRLRNNGTGKQVGMQYQIIHSLVSRLYLEEVFGASCHKIPQEVKERTTETSYR